MEETRLVERAAAFAAKAHAGQKRKYTGEPYYNHVSRVAHLLILAPGTDEAMIAAAYLHDTIEDTAVTYEQVLAEFGQEVAGLVWELTNVYTPEAYPHLNRKARKALECERLAKVSARAKLIKRADIADNAKDIETLDPGFAKVWVPEKQALLKALIDEVEN